MRAILITAFSFLTTPSLATTSEEALFPRFIQACTVTRFTPVIGEPGGTGGHITLLLKGACMDSHFVYPRLRSCAEGEYNPADTNSGIGVSVNQVFKNVNWVAVPGRDMFYMGGLSPTDTLDQATYDQKATEFAGEGWFSGIQLREKLGATSLEKVARES